MATRARIALELKDGSFISSYQHWDGYPGGLGYTLCDHWNEYDKVKEGIELGDASKWAYMVGEKIDFDDRNAKNYDLQNVYQTVRHYFQAAQIKKSMQFRVLPLAFFK